MCVNENEPVRPIRPPQRETTAVDFFHNEKTESFPLSFPALCFLINKRFFHTQQQRSGHIWSRIEVVITRTTRNRGRCSVPPGLGTLALTGFFRFLHLAIFLFSPRQFEPCSAVLRVRLMSTRIDVAITRTIRTPLHRTAP